MNAAMWKDGVLLLLRLATEAFNAGEPKVGLALLAAGMAASDELRKVTA